MNEPAGDVRSPGQDTPTLQISLLALKIGDRMALLLSIHGAAKTVTGSCLEFRSGCSRILLDCGLFQGSRSLEALNYQALAFDPKSIDAVIVSHAHIDHSGNLPKLLQGLTV